MDFSFEYSSPTLEEATDPQFPSSKFPNPKNPPQSHPSSLSDAVSADDVVMMTSQNQGEFCSFEAEGQQNLNNVSSSAGVKSNKTDMPNRRDNKTTETNNDELTWPVTNLNNNRITENPTQNVMPSLSVGVSADNRHIQKAVGSKNNIASPHVKVKSNEKYNSDIIMAPFHFAMAFSDDVNFADYRDIVIPALKDDEVPHSDVTNSRDSEAKRDDKMTNNKSNMKKCISNVEKVKI